MSKKLENCDCGNTATDSEFSNVEDHGYEIPALPVTPSAGIKATL